jgi:DnaJ-class molecular chaperone
MAGRKVSKGEVVKSTSFEKARTTERAQEILGLKPRETYTLDEIKAAYHQQALKWHPDKHPIDQQAQAELMFCSINYAYEFLTNPSFRRKENLQMVPDVVLRHVISFDEGFFGTKIICAFSFGNPEKFEDRGFKFEVEPSEIEILPGTLIADFTFPNKGVEKDGVRSNVIVHIEQAKHPLFTMQGMDIHCTKSVPLEILLCGGTIDVETMYGIKELKIPPGTAPGTKLVLPHVGVNLQGCQYVEIQQVFPAVEELKTKNEWKGLQINWETIA